PLLPPPPRPPLFPYTTLFRSDHSHEEHYITEATVDGQRQRATWKSDISTPTLTPHLAGERYFGVKKGRMTMQVTVDCDRHGGEVDRKSTRLNSSHLGISYAVF